MKKFSVPIFILTFALWLISDPLTIFAQGDSGLKEKPIRLRTMGSMLFGGDVAVKPNGDTFHGDHGYAQYYIPANARQFPLIFWHGLMQSGKTWEATPDGREGFQAIFPRDDWAVYIIDQPIRGRAGYTQTPVSGKDDVPAASQEGATWTVFRNGIWTPPG